MSRTSVERALRVGETAVLQRRPGVGEQRGDAALALDTLRSRAAAVSSSFT